MAKEEKRNVELTPEQKRIKYLKALTPENVLELAKGQGFKSSGERHETVQIAILQVLLEIRDKKK